MVKQKHVLFIVENNSVPDDERVWQEALAARDFGFLVSVICPRSKSSPKPAEVIQGIKIYRHPTFGEARKKSMFFVEYANALFWEFIFSLLIFFRKPFKIIHSANPPDHVFLITLFFKLFGVKYVFDHHDISPENYLAKFGEKDFFYRGLLLFEKLTFITADVVISTNESYKRIALSRGNKNSEEVFVVRNGPDLSKVKFMPPNPKLKNGFAYLVAYIGVIGSQEEIDNLLRSVEYIVYRRGITNTKFIIVGTGPNWQEMLELSQEMGLSKYVHFTGFVPYDIFYEVLATADIGVNPEFKNSFTDKSTMIKIMEYMTFGLPIVQFDVTEGKVTADGASVYVQRNDEKDFAEAIICLLKNPEKRKVMGEIGRRRIREKLSWDIQKGNLKMAYEYLHG